MSKKTATVGKFRKRNKKHKQNWLRTVRYYYLRIIRLQGTPEKISRGIACGVFAGSFPFFGLQTIIGVALAVLLRGNKIAAAAATWISNPFTYIPIFAFNYQIGCIFLNIDRSSSYNKIDLQTVADVMILAKEKAIILTVGSAAVGFFLAIISYFLSIKLIDRWRRSGNFKYGNRSKGNNNSFIC